MHMPYPMNLTHSTRDTSTPIIPTIPVGESRPYMVVEGKEDAGEEVVDAVEE